MKKAAALGLTLAASLAAAQSTTSSAPLSDSEAPKTASASATPASPETHRLGGGFRGKPVSVSPTPRGPESKSPATSAKPPAKAKPAIINNQTVGTGARGVQTTHGESAPAGPPPPTPATAVGSPQPVPGARDLQGHDESYWRERARAARDRVEKAREAVVSADADEHRLENDFYAWDDGQYRDRVIKPEWEKAKQALADAQAEVIAAEAALDDLSEDARKSGALPGWLR